ncbi:hypothetical protein Pfo_006254 [Paulownia fortunei]|nr:hypothetical protein Pfo_006254 [Paulownia fortunei]
MDSNSQSPSICQRLINFILSLLNRPPMPPGSAQVPTEEGSSRNGKSSIRPINKPNGYVGSEIVVDFRHTDGSESWTQINERGGLIRAPKKDGLILSNDQTILQNGVDKKEKNKDHFAPKIDQKTGRQALQELEALDGRDARRKGLKKNTVKESEGKKEANQLAGQATMVNNQPHQDTKPRPPRHLGPLLSVASNINEKSDAYIKSRKKSLGRNYSLDPEKS